MVKKIFIVILVLMILMSCRAFRFQPMDIPQKQLPPLKSQISVITEGAMPDVILSLTETRGISSAVLKALCSSEGDFQGSIKCDVRLSRKTSSAIWEFTCYMFCGLFNIIGLPAGVYKNQADVAIHIYDLSGNHIGTYQGVGFDKRTIACYYGYSIKNTTRTSVEQALVNAMGEVSNKIQRDYTYITEMLDKNIEQLKKEKKELELDFEIRRKN